MDYRKKLRIPCAITPRRSISTLCRAFVNRGIEVFRSPRKSCCMFSLSDGHDDFLDTSDTCRLIHKLFAEEVRRTGESAVMWSTFSPGELPMVTSRRPPCSAGGLPGSPELIRESVGLCFSESSSMMDRQECTESSGWQRVSPVAGGALAVVASSNLLAASVPSSLTIFFRLVTLGDLLVKVLAMLVTLNFRIIDDADERTACSLLARAVMPGKGKIPRVQTSATRASSRALSPGDGARTGSRPVVVSNDCERLIDAVVVLLVDSFSMVVFFNMTWDIGDLAPTVVARCMDILRATVPMINY